jgi:hypothetical protein
MMRRREFIAGLAGAAGTWPRVARAQQPKMPVVGLLVTGSVDPNTIYVAAFRKGLGEMGVVAIGGGNPMAHRDGRHLDRPPSQSRPVHVLLCGLVDECGMNSGPTISHPLGGRAVFIRT